MTLVRDKKKRQITKATSLRTDQKEGRYFRSEKRETNRSRKKKGRKGTKKRGETVESSTKSLSLQSCPPRYWTSERGTRNCADEVTRMPGRTPFPSESIEALSLGRMSDSPCTCLAVLRSRH